MTWTVMKKAMERGCDSIDFMGRGDFKAKFGAELEVSKYRWVRSRYKWLFRIRLLAERGYRWQQSVRGRIVRKSLAGLRGRPAAPAASAEGSAAPAGGQVHKPSIVPSHDYG
jgi:hypothetical protein